MPETWQVLSVRQPFASLLLHPIPDLPVAYKWCENRTWKADLADINRFPASLLPGDDHCPRLYIHATRPVPKHWDIWCTDIVQQLPTELPRNSIIGSVRLLSIMPAVSTHRESARNLVAAASGLSPESIPDDTMDFCDEHDNRLHWWLCDRPIPLSQPIPNVLGSLRIWHYTPK